MKDAKTTKDVKVHRLVYAALMTAVICVLSPFTIPIGPVPISMTILALFFAVYVCGTKRAVLCCLLYILIGLVGVPVFSGFGSGAGKLFGPTGGYILGYIFLTVISGLFVDKFPDRRLVPFLGMIIGVAVCYAFGTAWFICQNHMAGKATTLYGALAACVLPFIPFDLAKAAVAVLIGPKLRGALSRYRA